MKPFTIDDAHTRDMDDAISVQRDGDHWDIRVHIADVAGSIFVDSPYDQRARDLVVSRYLPNKTIGMLPGKFSEDRLSLWPDKKRPVLTIGMKVNSDFELVSHDLSFEEIESRAKLAYDQIPHLLSDDKSQCREALNEAVKLAHGLLARRRAQGALALYDLNNGWITTEEGHLRQFTKKEEAIGHIIIQELMVLANAAVAEWCVKEDIPVIYRNHQARNAAPDRAELVRQLDDAIHTPMANIDAVRQRTHMLLDRAHYDATVLGHYGLNLPVYLHATSPIRRYPDLINHRQIRAHLRGETLPYTQDQLVGLAEHINKVIEEQRSKKAEHMKDRANQRAERRLERGSLRTVSDKELERIIKVAQSSPPEGLIEEIKHRLSEDRLPLLHQFMVMESPRSEWGDLRETILKDLKPEDAVSILSMASQMGWPETIYSEDTNSEGWFLCFAKMPDFEGGANYIQVRGMAKSKKLAKQLASKELLALTLGVILESPPTEQSSTPSTDSIERPTLTPGRDPVSVLQEWAQQNGVPLPTYSFSGSGPSHVPTFVSRCECFGVGREGKAPSKKEAKKRSAQAVLEALAELPHDSNLRHPVVPNQSS